MGQFEEEASRAGNNCSNGRLKRHIMLQLQVPAGDKKCLLVGRSQIVSGEPDANSLEAMAISVSKIPIIT